MTFGTPVGKEEAARIVHWALDHGVNFIDTADMYEGYTRFMGSPGGKSEEFLGEALQGRRKDAVVTTKAGNPVGPGPRRYRTRPCAPDAADRRQPAATADRLR